MFHPSLNQIAILSAFAAGAGAKNGINITLKNVHRAFVVCIIGQGNDATQVTFKVRQSTGNAGSAGGTGETDLLVDVPVYYNENCDLSNILTAGTATLGSYQTDANKSRSKMVIFDIIPERDLDVANGFDCIVVNTTGDPGAANVAGMFAILIPDRYAPVATVYSD